MTKMSTSAKHNISNALCYRNQNTRSNVLLLSNPKERNTDLFAKWEESKLYPDGKSDVYANCGSFLVSVAFVEPELTLDNNLACYINRKTALCYRLQRNDLKWHAVTKHSD